MSNIVRKTKDIIILKKPVGTPSQPDPSGEPDAMTLLASELRSLGERSELFPIHRIDRTVGGLLLFARNKRSAAELSSDIAQERIEKTYFAILEGEPPCDSARLSDYLFKDSVLKISRVVDGSKKGAKLAALDYSVIGKINTQKGVRTLVSIRLLSGRFHQIRAQFSSRGLPLVGDKKYGSREVMARVPALFSAGLEFELYGERITEFSLPDTDKYPWNLFTLECYKNC